MRFGFVIVSAFLILVIPAVVFGGQGLRSGVRDFLGSRTHNTYSVYTVEQVIENHSASLSVGRTVRYIGVGDLNMSSMDLKQAQAAYNFHKRIALSNVVRLEFDSQQQDSQGHLRAYVFIKPWPNSDNELFLNAQLIEQGHARFVPDKVNVKYNEYFRGLEEKAILARRGIWSVPSITREDY